MFGTIQTKALRFLDLVKHQVKYQTIKKCSANHFGASILKAYIPMSVGNMKLLVLDYPQKQNYFLSKISFIICLLRPMLAIKEFTMRKLKLTSSYKKVK